MLVQNPQNPNPERFIYTIFKDVVRGGISWGMPFVASKIFFDNISLKFQDISSFFQADKINNATANGEVITSVLEITKEIASSLKAMNQMNSEDIQKSFETIIKESAKASFSSWVPVILAMGVASTIPPLVYQYIQRVLLHNIGKPALAIKQHKITYLGLAKDKIKDTLINLGCMNPPEKLLKPIFKKELDDQIEEIVRSIKNIKKNQAYFQNMIIYGEGGTGKTMIAEKIAKEAGMNFTMMRGGDLGPFIKRGEHVTELTKLLDSANNSSVPTVLFIDESEGFCRDRKDLDQDRLELLNTFLNLIGTQSKKIMVILATNLIGHIDRAIINRMTHKINVDLPGIEERAKIIDLYANQFFTDEKERNTLFHAEKIQELARKTEKLSGRSLFQIINMLFAKKGETDDNQLTEKMIDFSVDRYIKQEHEVAQQQGVAVP